VFRYIPGGQAIHVLSLASQPSGHIPAVRVFFTGEQSGMNLFIFQSILLDEQRYVGDGS